MRGADGGLEGASDGSRHAAADGKLGTDSDAGPDTDRCDSLVINAQPNAPEVLIVLDRSGSMIGNNPTKTNRWNASSAVIKKITAQLDQTMHFGMMLFPDPAGGTGQNAMCAVGKLTVPIGVGNAAAIAKSIDASPPTLTSATPTAATLHEALSAIDSAPACADSCAAPHRYVLLVTDGAPNCGTGGYTTLDSDIKGCNDNIDALSDLGVTTYVIGYQTTDTSTAKIMDGFATHGGTGKQLPVEDEKSLLSTLTSIAGQLVACDYKLGGEVQDPKFVKVLVDGKQYDLGTGWTLKEDKRTIVLGSACDTLRDAKAHTLRITQECSEVPVIAI